MTTPHRKPDACSHYKAVQTGATEAHELADGTWEYSQRYECPTCGATFIETNSGHPNERRIVIVSPEQ